MNQILTIAEILKSSKLEWDAGFLAITCSSTSKDALEEGFRRLGFSGDMNLIHSTAALVGFSIDLSADSWTGNPPFYRNLSELWADIQKKQRIPENYFVMEGNHYSGGSSNKILKKFEFYVDWLKFINSLKDHGGEAQNPRIILFIGTEKGAKKYEINPRDITYEVIQKTDISLEHHRALEKLNGLISLDDAHQSERKDTLRTSLAEILEEEHSESTAKWLITQTVKLKKKYQENYDVYLHKFSVNKLLAEIEEKSTDYIAKINDSVSSSQGKAFAIPGALIAIAALLKSADLLSMILICFGLLSVSFLTIVANNIQCEAYNALSSQIKRSLNRYEIIKNEQDVRVSAEAAKEELLNLIDKARRRLNYINTLSVAVFIIGLAYGLFVYFRN
ncbi:hypothetical protein [Pseudomonas oryzihabitans]|uniref:hypothetical protein n=1 Tax=Pseudomonas oryzihabitans TaxID=47885 RepID=UPI00111D4AD4|nr:hypothetical protein [Pseudomonas psychrotolerans]